MIDTRARRDRKRRKKGISPGITIAIAAICSAIAFSAAYVYAMNTFNSKVTDLSEKQEMFTKIYEVDSAVRENYNGEIDEEKLREALSSTYVKSVDKDNIIYVPENQYDEGKYSSEYKEFKISDGSYVLIKKTSLKDKQSESVTAGTAAE